MHGCQALAALGPKPTGPVASYLNALCLESKGSLLKAAADADLWKDANDFLFYGVGKAILPGPDGKPIIIAETAYPFTLGWNDWTNNNIGLESQLAPGYPATPEGQTAFLQAVVDMAKAIPSGLGAGVFYWGGEWIATSPQDPNGSSWENQALFDFNSIALPAFQVFKHTH